MNRSLRSASLRSAPVGMTVGGVPLASPPLLAHSRRNESEEIVSITRRVAVGGLAALPFTQARAQQTFPTKPLTLVVPFPAGGPADIFGRNLAQGMTGRLRQGQSPQDHLRPRPPPRPPPP